MRQFNYEELAALHAIARILAQPLELREQLEKILHELSARVGMERGMISILDQETGQAWLDVASGIDLSGREVTYKPGEGITGQVAQSGRPMAIANLGKESLFLDRTGARRKLNRSELAFLCVPIIYDGRTVGVLSADKAAHAVRDLDYEIDVLSAVAELIARSVHMRGIEEENRRLRKILSMNKPPIAEIVAASKAMQEVFGMVTQVSKSRTTVLIHGETGTGKELLARAIHMNSPRKDKPLVLVNCSAIPDTLLESELFGHERGAFTGATQRRHGLFRKAHGGTIFLDEVAELSETAQAKLLRVIQEKEVQPLGSSQIISVDTRIIAATNRDLEEEVQKGNFRADLYYRLNVFPIYIPPLRERPSDIIPLADHFVLKYAKELGKKVQRISNDALSLLLSYSWPGNVRELQNCIERAVLLAQGDSIESMHLPPSLQKRTSTNGKSKKETLYSIISEQEKALILDALKKTKGNQSKSAELLGTTKRVIQYKVKKYGIDPKKFRAGI
ncbi:MAG: sigma-54-dependent Fis family transcriptional regulator [Deltaproteobacteria bacterium]|nr:MAG: sigma-54-dependent Fis family transcriptional regulator [Deltaproteobacteria bacterium]